MCQVVSRRRAITMETTESSDPKRGRGRFRDLVVLEKF